MTDVDVGHTVRQPMEIFSLLVRTRSTCLVLLEDIESGAIAQEAPVIECYQATKELSEALHHLLVTVGGGSFTEDG